MQAYWIWLSPRCLTPRSARNRSQVVESDLKPLGGIVAAGFDEFRWPRPGRPGDELRVESEILEVRPSRSCLDQGLIKMRTTTLNQNDEAVQVTIGSRSANALSIMYS